MSKRSVLSAGQPPEYQIVSLDSLIYACVVFEEKWRVLRPHKSEASPDAITAILQLHADLEARRVDVLALLDSKYSPMGAPYRPAPPFP